LPEVVGLLHDARRLRRPSSAPGSTIFRSRSSLRPRASRSSRRSNYSSGWAAGWICEAHDADPRQETLEATIRWSYDLLSLEEQRLFGGSRCSSAVARTRPRRRCARRRSTRCSR
jgi:hypothetical protein